MHDSELRELQKDTFTIVIALIIALAAVLAYAVLAVTSTHTNTTIWWWLPPVLGISVSVASYQVYKSGHFRPATIIFIGGLIVTVISFMTWPLARFAQREVYLLLPVVAMTGLLITPRAALHAANLAVLATLSGALLVFGWIPDIYLGLIFPLSMVYAMAAISWISSSHLTTTLQWAYNSQARAQQRSRELFESQTELQKAYQLLETTNIRLQQAEAEARQANEFKTRFITNLSHELRMPLSAIINFSFILSKNRYGDVTEEQRDYLNRIQDAGELLLEIVNDLLDLAKIEAGQMELFIEPVDLAAIGRSVLNTVSGLLEDKPVQLKTNIASNLPPVNADGTRIRQILLNLLGNAAKYTDSGSITLKMAPDGDVFVRVSIIDTGIGIKPEDFERIFEEFQQTDDAFALRKVGTGLGLPISRKFVELHGGKLWVESRYGRGATFHLTLPVAPQPALPNPLPVPKNSEFAEVISL